MKDVMDASVTPRKFNLTLMMIFAAVALALAAVGIYGVVAYSVTQRTHEIGVRVALGAQPRDVIRLVLGEGARLAVLGAILGLAAAAALTRFMDSLLFGVAARDPLTFLAVAVSLRVVPCAWIPWSLCAMNERCEVLNWKNWSKHARALAYSQFLAKHF
jgi:putative ABC transport system permease protein